MKKSSLLILFLISSSLSHAELCSPRKVRSKHFKEIELMNLISGFNLTSPKGGRYAARVLACNNRADFKKSHTRKSEEKLRDLYLARSLRPKFITGFMNYLNFAPLRYAYRLEKIDHEFQVTIYGRFFFGLHRYIDIDFQMYKELNWDKNHGPCSKSIYKSRFGKKKIYRGKFKNKFGQRLCRLARKRKIKGRKVQDYLMLYWKKYIEKYWTRPGLKLTFIPTNLKGRKGISRRFIWPIRFNHLPEGRATYRPLFLIKPFPLYTGIPKEVFTHEAGHMLGLNDEYQEFRSQKRWKNCRKEGGAGHIMCSSRGATQKAIYPWLMVKRYL